MAQSSNCTGFLRIPEEWHMPNEVKAALLGQLTERFGHLRKLPASQSLYEIGDGVARLYIRYSRVHPGNRTFFGLRAEDLKALEGHPSLICFLWDNQSEPLFVPFSDYEEVLQSTPHAGDGQYKVQVYLQPEATELYIARAGRFNVDAHLGWQALEALTSAKRSTPIPELLHSQVQTLLGAIGSAKGFDIWVPPNDRDKLDWSISARFDSPERLPHGFENVKRVIQEVDVIWIRRGSGELRALFEVEHSTSIYSGLLRFNDIHLVAPSLRPTFSVVANEQRRQVFVRQLNRPTFQASGLSEMCTFLDYTNVFEWHERVKEKSGSVADNG